MNTLPPTLKNTYYIMRHGRSKGNEKGIIISHHSNAINDCALTKEGREQVKKVINENTFSLNTETVIYCSDFLRAKQTAEIVQEYLRCKPISYTPALRDRDFGELEGQSEANHKRVWEIDSTDPDHKEFKNESANEVMERTTKLITELEEKHSNQNILLVAHGDTLQILAIAFQKKPASLHRSIPTIQNAEILRLN